MIDYHVHEGRERAEETLAHETEQGSMIGSEYLDMCATILTTFKQLHEAVKSFHISSVRRDHYYINSKPNLVPYFLTIIRLWVIQ